MTKQIDIILLCGGKGTRLKKLTQNIPKPLLKIGNKPFIYYVINKFIDDPMVSKIILACGYKHGKFYEFLNKHPKFQKKTKIVNSGIVDILTRIKNSQKAIKNDFLVCYGDSFADIDIKKYYNYFIKNKLSSCLLSSNYKIEFGVLKTKHNNVIKFNEKPHLKIKINLGYILFKKSFFSTFSKKTKNWVDFLKKISALKKLNHKNFTGEYITFNNSGELANAKTKIKLLKL
jgi:glucose-1-phosphate cytidylyltransferase